MNVDRTVFRLEVAPHPVVALLRSECPLLEDGERSACDFVAMVSTLT